MLCRPLSTRPQPHSRIRRPVIGTGQAQHCCSSGSSQVAPAYHRMPAGSNEPSAPLDRPFARTAPFGNTHNLVNNRGQPWITFW